MPLLPLLTSEHSLPGQPLLTAGQDYFSPPGAWIVPSSTAMTASRNGAYEWDRTDVAIVYDTGMCHLEQQALTIKFGG